MKKFQAIVWTFATVLIAIGGFSGYSDGSSYIEWFGIKLSETGFTWLVIGFAVSDIFMLVRAFGKDKFVEGMKEKAEHTAAESTEMEAPCTVSLTRPANILGAAMGVRVFLNGAEQEVLKNGKTIVMQTMLANNELTVRYNADDTVRTLNFDASPGGRVRIKLKYVKVQLTIEESTASGSSQKASPKQTGTPSGNENNTPVAGELRFDKNMEDYMAIAGELYPDKNIREEPVPAVLTAPAKEKPGMNAGKSKCYVFGCYDSDRVFSLAIFPSMAGFYTPSNVVAMVRKWQNIPDTMEVEYFEPKNWDAPKIKVASDSFAVNVDVLYNKAERFLVEKAGISIEKAGSAGKTNMPYPNQGLLLLIYKIK